MIKNTNKFKYGTIVFHISSQEKHPGVVTAVSFLGGLPIYTVDWGPVDGASDHHEVALSDVYTPDFSGS